MCVLATMSGTAKPLLGLVFNINKNNFRMSSLSTALEYASNKSSNQKLLSHFSIVFLYEYDNKPLFFLPPAFLPKQDGCHLVSARGFIMVQVEYST
mmetsp:Transcript_56085/g.167862  ORF Transcript_56085/g.167862 Transcript_56085/m.167862 type:complete len:96 (+) Transcript_56085:693-980(+)